MKELLRKFPPDVCSKYHEDDKHDTSHHSIFVTKPQKVFDLHGYWESEISGKMDFIWEFSDNKHYSRIKIVTGKGKQILFSEVKRILTQKYNKKLLSHFEYDEGSFEVWF